MFPTKTLFYVVRRGQYRGKSCVSFLRTKTMQYSKRDFRVSKRVLLVGGSFIGLSSLQPKTLSPRQESILLGNLLGDGHMQLAPNEKSAL